MATVFCVLASDSDVVCNVRLVVDCLSTTCKLFCTFSCGLNFIICQHLQFILCMISAKEASILCDCVPVIYALLLWHSTLCQVLRVRLCDVLTLLSDVFWLCLDCSTMDTQRHTGTAAHNINIVKKIYQSALHAVGPRQMVSNSLHYNEAAKILNVCGKARCRSCKFVQFLIIL